MANVVSFHESIASPGDSGGVVAILTEPGSEITGQQRPSVTLLNAGVIHRVGPHRLHVRLARALAAAGFPALRLDLSGIGDSRPLAEGLTFRESAVADIRTALDWQAARLGDAPAILFGICSGADNALAAALQDTRVAGIVLVDPHAYATRRARLRQLRRMGPRALLRRVGARLLPRASRAHAGDGAPGGSARQPPPREDMRGQLQALVARGVRILSIHTLAQGQRNNHVDQVFESFPELRGKVDTLYFPRANHTFTALSEQAALIDAVVQWCGRRFPAS